MLASARCCMRTHEASTHLSAVLLLLLLLNRLFLLLIFFQKMLRTQCRCNRRRWG
jgi:hypothetical protein